MESALERRRIEREEGGSLTNWTNHNKRNKWERKWERGEEVAVREEGDLFDSYVCNLTTAIEIQVPV
jgi:hypothetical protein